MVFKCFSSEILVEEYQEQETKEDDDVRQTSE